jgi:hypothetical protein
MQSFFGHFLVIEFFNSHACLRQLSEQELGSLLPGLVYAFLVTDRGRLCRKVAISAPFICKPPL